MVHAFKNSRKIAVCLALALIVAFAGFALNSRSVRAAGIVESGTGWTLSSDGTLTINGNVDFSELSNFSNRREVKNLVVESGISGIPEIAFENFQYLETVTLSREVNTIGHGAFQHCTNLTSVNLEGVSFIANNAFAECFSLSSVSFGKNIKIGSHAFYRCKELSSVNFGGLTKIPEYAFASTALETIDLSGIDTVNDCAFNGCTALETVVLGNSHKVIKYGCFQGCTKLSNIDLGYVENIGINAFSGCTSLNSVDLSSVRLIERNAFEGCTGLTTINLPVANSIGKNAFTGCTGLTTVNFGESSVYVGDEAFKNCSSLTTINTEKISAIYDGVFSNCTSLQTVTLGSGITAIGEQSFYQCTALTTINLANIKTIKTQAFAGCVLLNNIDISDCPYIYANAFNGCTGLTSVDLSGTTSLYQGAFSGCTELTAVILREDLSYIPDYAFDGCSKLTSANIDAPYIGSYAFRNTGFTSLDLRNVSAFSDGAFAGCENLTDLTLGYKFGSYTNSDDPAKDSFVFENVTKLYYFGPQRLFDERGIGADFPNAEVTVGGAYYVIIDYVEYQMSDIVEEGELLTVPGEPSRTGFRFTGWYSDKACTIPFDFSKPVTKDLTIYTGWIKDVSESVFKGYTVSLEGDIGVNYYTIMPEDADPDRDYMKFTVEDEPGAHIIYIKDASTITYDGTTYRVFKIRVPAKKMTASIDAQLYVNDQRVAEKWWTVKNYADYILSNPSKYKTAEPLVRAMLHYGAYAQIFFNYKTDKLANANLINDTNYTLDDAVFTRPYDSSKTNLPAGLEFSNVSLTLQTTTTLNLYFTDNTNKNLTFKLVNGTKETTITPIVSGSQKLIKITNIPAGSLDSEYTVKIVVEGDSTEYVVKYNPMTYAYNVITREQTEVRTPELKNLMKALYLYSEAAKKYINS